MEDIWLDAENILLSQFICFQGAPCGHVQQALETQA